MEGSDPRPVQVEATDLVEPSQADAFDSVLFLVGHWRNETEGGALEELWSGPDGQEMIGLNQGTKDFAFFEHLRIEIRGQDVVYVAAPGGERSTEFVLEDSNPGFVMFKNPAHNFPQQIRYRRDGDTLSAVAEDLAGDQQLEFEWELYAAEVTEELR